MAKATPIIVVLTDLPHADGQHVTVTATTLIGGKIVNINIVTMSSADWENVKNNPMDEGSVE
jgi:hypothetical protein